MSRLKNLLCVCLSLYLLFNSLLTVAATHGPIITVDSISVVPGDTVIVNISLSENPGIMAMTFAISYDVTVLSYQGYKEGILSDYTVVDHPDRGYVSFVNTESYDQQKEGIILSLVFNVREDVALGIYPIKIMNIRPEKNGESMEGCFANWNRDVITPTIINGSVIIGDFCETDIHYYGDWAIDIEATAETTGRLQKKCMECGYAIYKTIPILPHGGALDEDIKWEINIITGNLLIEGDGTVEDFDYASNTPWYKFKNFIDTVRIGDGITRIGANSFNNSYNLKRVIIPKSVVSVAKDIFVINSTYSIYCYPSTTAMYYANDYFIDCCLFGDIDGTGKINSNDLVLLRKVILGVFQSNELIADVSYDEKVDIKDLICLKKLLA